MNTINKLLSFALMMLCGLVITSCADENDWDIDKTFDRLFGVNEDNISVTASMFSADVTFSKVSGAEYYVIEVSTDSLSDDVAMGGANAIVYGADNHDITTSPATIDGLQSDTRYYLRIKSMSTTKNESRWVYYNDGATFRTQAEQIFNSVTDADRGSERIRLSWTPGAEVTHLLVISAGTAGNDTTTIQLTDPDMIAAGEYTVENLNPSTTYTFVIYNGDTKRGTISATTAAAMPEGDYQIELPSTVTTLTQDMLDEYAALAQAEAGSTNASLTIGFQAGTTVAMNDIDEDGGTAKLVVPDGLSITFFGLAGTKPVLNFTQSLDIAGTHGFIRFDNVDIQDGGCQYLINQSSACSVGEMSFSGVNINSLNRSLVRFQGDDAKTITNLVIDNCFINDQGSGGYAMIRYDSSSYTLETITITNSTFSNQAHNFIQAGNVSGLRDITIQNCTFYNVAPDGRYFMDIRGTSPTISITNSIFALCGATSSGVRADSTPIASNNYMTSDFVFGSYATFSADVTSPVLTAAELFEDADNLNFAVTADRLTSLGDQRWNTAQ